MILSIITYNICHGEGLDKCINVRRQAEFVKSKNVDIALLQEIDYCTERSGKIDEAEEFSKYSEMQECVKGINIKHSGGFYGNCILSKYKLIDSKNYLFSKSSEENEQRGMLYAKIEIDGNKIHLFNTHLSVHQDERLSEINEIIKIIEKIDKEDYIILGGDFNVGIEKIGKHKYKYNKKDNYDEYILLRKKLNKIDNKELTWFSEIDNACIDTLFYSNNMKIRRFETIKSNLSDHYPILMEVEIN